MGLSSVKFHQRVSTARYASAGIATNSGDVRLSVCLSVRSSVRHTLVPYCIKINKANVMISSPMESPKTLVFADISFIPTFEMGHPERGR